MRGGAPDVMSKIGLALILTGLMLFVQFYSGLTNRPQNTHHSLLNQQTHVWRTGAVLGQKRCAFLTCYSLYLELFNQFLQCRHLLSDF